jgi:hypothetical protein
MEKFLCRSGEIFFKETRKQKIIMMKKEIHAKKKIQGKKGSRCKKISPKLCKVDKKKVLVRA